MAGSDDSARMLRYLKFLDMRSVECILLCDESEMRPRLPDGAGREKIYMSSYCREEKSRKDLRRDMVRSHDSPSASKDREMLLE